MRQALLLLLVCLLAACAVVPTAQERGQHMDALAAARGWQKLRLPAGDFVLTAYIPGRAMPAKVLTVYIEGDGMAWLTSSLASDNPTPRKPLSLELALRHTDGAVVYLARPCQNVVETDWGKCQQADWTGRRYASEVIESSSQAISALKERYGAEKLVLVGYSGGGAVAALVAARRQDVVRLITLAGNLDTRAWTTMHHIDPLTGSLNPADEWEKLQFIPQVHFVGGKDPVITDELVASYVARFPVNHKPPMRVVADFDHSCCWVEQWPRLMQEVFP